MRYLTLVCGCLALLGLNSWWCLAEPPAPAAPVAKGLKVHEWGVFRVHNDTALANADMRAVWAGLPRFVYGQVAARSLPRHWQNVEIVDRPVLFFHTPKAVDVELKVDFPGGTPAVWWPGTERPALHGATLVGAAGQQPPFRSLEWRLRLKEPPNVARAPALPAAAEGHWVKTLRAVQADDVFARVGERNFGCERERFVYYDGLLPRGKWLAVAVKGERVELRNQVDHPVFDVTVVDRRTPGKVRVARLARLDGQAATRALKFTEPEAKGWSTAAVRELAAQLKATGLHADEAGSLAELWKKELFETEGVTAFYRLPQSEYDRLLPLTMSPRPEELVRVGLVIHPHCEPDLAERVARLARELDSDNFATREAAEKRLDALAGAAVVYLKRLETGKLSAEARRRVERLINKHDAEKAIVK
ncbi:MAG TPA: hypothetical protein VFE78_13990 [Gemmataceae bacterium]|jgi:hypothetical protein|nr:hypothetical protein [Gemmataceae bacterium]